MTLQKRSQRRVDVSTPTAIQQAIPSIKAVLRNNIEILVALALEHHERLEAVLRRTDPLTVRAFSDVLDDVLDEGDEDMHDVRLLIARIMQERNIRQTGQLPDPKVIGQDIRLTRLTWDLLDD